MLGSLQTIEFLLSKSVFPLCLILGLFVLRFNLSEIGHIFLSEICSCPFFEFTVENV